MTKKANFKLSSNRALINPTPLAFPKSFVALLILSVPFLLVGIWITGSYFGFFSANLGGNVTEPRILLIVGLVFLLSGLGIFLFAFSHLLKILFKNNLRKRHPYEAWLWDYSWNRRGQTHSFLKRLLYNLFGLFLVLGIFLPGLYIAYVKGSMPLFFKVIMSLFIFLYLGICIREIIKTLKFRSVRCLYTQFPYRIGKDFSVNLEGLPNAKSIESISCKIKCYEFRVIESSKSNKKVFERVSVELYSEDIPLEISHIKDGRVGISGRFPNKKSLGTDFTKNDYICWELSVNAKVPGVDFNYAFILPVYN